MTRLILTHLIHCLKKKKKKKFNVFGCNNFARVIAIEPMVVCRL